MAAYSLHGSLYTHAFVVFHRLPSGSSFLPPVSFFQSTPVGLSGPYLLPERHPKRRVTHTPQLGLSGLEPPTSRLSGVRSNRLSYKPF